MRLRNIPRADGVLAQSAYVVQEPAAHKGHWQELFGNDHPLHLEIGMGKGQFLIGMAQAHPDINYIGIERYASVLLRAEERLEAAEEPLSNLKLVCIPAEFLGDLFAPGEISRLYLNFSDPWPKDRHHKRRLTSREFLKRYEAVLAPGSLLEFKTDNTGLFDFSLEEIPAAGWTLTACTRDLHRDPLCEGNIMTEYEAKFSALGNPICKCIARFDGQA